VALALEAAALAGRSDAAAHARYGEIQKSWTDELGLTQKQLSRGIELTGPVLTTWPGTWRLGYYGALKGLDHLADVDALVTMGDPRPNTESVALTAVYLGLAEDDLVARLTRAELEQAHGRIRAPQRTRPARALHVGVVLPGGHGWDRATWLPAGDLRAPRAAMDADQFRAAREALGLTQDELAEHLEVGRASVQRYEAGRPIPTGVVMRIRSMMNDK
jgi:hypothetical protein